MKPFFFPSSEFQIYKTLMVFVYELYFWKYVLLLNLEPEIISFEISYGECCFCRINE